MASSVKKLTAVILILMTGTGFGIPTDNADTQAERANDMTNMTTATLRVETSGLGDYFNTIVRIISVHDADNNEIYKRPKIGGYLKNIELNAPGTYKLKVLCERWYLLEFEHPIAEVAVEPGQEYLISCARDHNGVSAIITPIRD